MRVEIHKKEIREYMGKELISKLEYIIYKKDSIKYVRYTSKIVEYHYFPLIDNSLNLDDVYNRNEVLSLYKEDQFYKILKIYKETRGTYEDIISKMSFKKIIANGYLCKYILHDYLNHKSHDPYANVRFDYV